MKKIHCIVDKSGSMTLFDKGEIVQQMILALKQASDFSKNDFGSFSGKLSGNCLGNSFEREEFEIIVAEWDGLGEDLPNLLDSLGAKQFILFTDGYFLDKYSTSFREKKALSEKLTLNKTGCVVLVGADSSDQCNKVIKSFPGYDLMEALDYVLE